MNQSEQQDQTKPMTTKDVVDRALCGGCSINRPEFTKWTTQKLERLGKQEEEVGKELQRRLMEIEQSK